MEKLSIPASTSSDLESEEAKPSIQDIGVLLFFSISYYFLRKTIKSLGGNISLNFILNARTRKNNSCV